jgi:hypothetical protein
MGTIPGIVHTPKMQAGQHGSKLIHVEFAQQDRPGTLEPFDDRGVIIRDIIPQHL